MTKPSAKVMGSMMNPRTENTLLMPLGSAFFAAFSSVASLMGFLPSLGNLMNWARIMATTMHAAAVRKLQVGPKVL